MGERVYTASETPVEIALPFHHEMSLINEPCSKLFFVCTQPPAFGGETSIVRSDVVVEEMEKALPEVMTKFNEVGVMSILHTRNVEQRNGENVEKVWQRMLKTKDEEEARKRAMEKLACNSVTFNSDGTADFYYGPMSPTRVLNGRKVWFISVLGYSMEERDGYVTYGDGSKIPDKVTETFSKILEDNRVDIAWEKGDLLVVDNFRAQHARRAGKPPRCILVSLCK